MVEPNCPADTAAATAAAPIVVLTCHDVEEGQTEPIMSKRFELGADGKATKTASAYLRRGVARVLTVGPHELAALINGMPSAQAIMPGQPIDPRAQAQASAGTMQIVMQHEAEPPRTWARCKRHFGWTAGRPAWWGIDIDDGDFSDAMRNKINGEFGGDMVAALASLCPGLLDAARVVRPSSSAGVVDAAGKPYGGGLGRHIYLPAKDGADIPRATEVLAARLRLAGMGNCIPSKDGRVLVRQLIDATVSSPERVFFEGKPWIGPAASAKGWWFDGAGRAAAQAFEGGFLDTVAALPDLTEREAAQDRAWRDAERERLKPECAQRNAAWAKERGAQARREALAAGADESAAAEAARRAGADARNLMHGTLPGSMALRWDNPALDGKTGADMLDDPDAFDSATLADPIEPGRSNHAVAYARGKDGEGGPRIVSLHHGMQRWFPRHDAATLGTRVRAAGADALPELERLLPWSDVDSATIADLTAVAAKLSGINGNAAGGRVRAVTGRMAREKAARAAEGERQREWDKIVLSDTRVPVLVPGDKNAEFAPAVLATARALAAATGPDPVMCLPGIGPVSVVHSATQRTPILDDTDAIAPRSPQRAAFARYRKAQFQARCAKDIVFLAAPANGKPGWRNLHCPDKVTEALLQDSAGEYGLPLAHSIMATPALIYQPGRAQPVIDIRSPGLNRQHGVYLAATAEFCAAAAPTDLSDEAVLAAYKFLTQDLLVDMPFATDADRVRAVTELMTPLARPLLGVAPGFLNDGGRRGSGKTTLAILAGLTAEGAAPGVTPWPTNEDERSKLLLAKQIDGGGVQLFDNVARGTELFSAVVECALTAEQISGRVLGETRVVTLRNTTTVIFTGNNLKPAGDLPTRLCTIRLDANCARPELRTFRHPHINAYALARRALTARALSTLMAAGSAAPDDRLPWPESRYPDWDHIVGRGATLGAYLAGTDIAGLKLVGSNEAGDDAGDDARAGAKLEWLAHVFGCGAPFTAQELADTLGRLPIGPALAEADRVAPRGPGTAQVQQGQQLLTAEFYNRMNPSGGKVGRVPVDAAGALLSDLKGNGVEIAEGVTAVLRNEPGGKGGQRTRWWVDMKTDAW